MTLQLFSSDPLPGKNFCNVCSICIANPCKIHRWTQESNPDQKGQCPETHGGFCNFHVKKIGHFLLDLPFAILPLAIVLFLLPFMLFYFIPWPQWSSPAALKEVECGNPQKLLHLSPLPLGFFCICWNRLIWKGGGSSAWFRSSMIRSLLCSHRVVPSGLPTIWRQVLWGEFYVFTVRRICMFSELAQLGSGEKEAMTGFTGKNSCKETIHVLHLLWITAAFQPAPSQRKTELNAFLPLLIMFKHLYFSQFIFSSCHPSVSDRFLHPTDSQFLNSTVPFFLMLLSPVPFCLC